MLVQILSTDFTKPRVKQITYLVFSFHIHYSFQPDFNIFLIFTGAKSIKWDFLHGLFENAIYGGRVDNNFDVRVLSAYLQQYFSDSLLVC